MSKDTFTTGETSGLTRIPYATLNRYVSEYREFFSQAATLPKRGRRFTHADIEKIVLIRRLNNERRTRENILAALRGEWEPPYKSAFDLEEALKIADQIREQTAHAVKLFERANAINNQVMRRQENMNHLVNKINQRDTQTQKLFEEILELKQEIAALKKANKGQSTGWFGR